MQTIKVYKDKTIARIEIDSAVILKNNKYYLPLIKEDLKIRVIGEDSIVKFVSIKSKKYLHLKGSYYDKNIYCIKEKGRVAFYNYPHNNYLTIKKNIAKTLVTPNLYKENYRLGLGCSILDIDKLKIQDTSYLKVGGFVFSPTVFVSFVKYYKENSGIKVKMGIGVTGVFGERFGPAYLKSITNKMISISKQTEGEAYAFSYGINYRNATLVENYRDSSTNFINYYKNNSVGPIIEGIYKFTNISKIGISVSPTFMVLNNKVHLVPNNYISTYYLLDFGN